MASVVALEGSVLSILVEPVKRDLDLTDTQIGLIVGVAHSLVSSLASLPLSRWADVGIRRTVLTFALLVCSLGTVSIGFASAFWPLLAARVVQGIGAGGGTTPGQSIIADLYPPHRRASALAALGVGVALASTAGVTAAAYVAEAYGWRWVFWSLGAPGLALAIMMPAIMREPERTVSRSGSGTAPFGVALRQLAALGTFRHVTLGMTLLFMGVMGVASWSAPYLMRSFDKTLAQIAPVVGIGMGATLAIGGVVGGVLGDRLSRLDLRWHLWLPLVGSVLSIPFMAAYILIPDFWTAVAFGAIAMTLLGLFSAPLQAAVLGTVNPRSRATSGAVMSIFTGGVGAAGGTFLVGVLSDRLEPIYGIHSLRWAIAALLPLCAWACVHLWIASKHYIEEARSAE